MMAMKINNCLISNVAMNEHEEQAIAQILLFHLAKDYYYYVYAACMINCSTVT